MSKKFVTVDNVLKRLGQNAMLRSGIMIALFSYSGITMQAAQDMRYYDQPIMQVENVVQVPSPAFSHGSMSHGIEFFMENTFTLSDQMQIAFNDLCKDIPEVKAVEPVFHFVYNNLSEIRAERVSIDCDITSMVLNVAFRLPHDILVSVMKPLETMDDNLVMFNVHVYYIGCK